jgi:RNA polymerase sigma-70 factor (ECF subfamily)
MLYASHFSFVWRNLRRMGVQEQTLEDAAQDVFMIVHQRFHTYDPARSAIETWLFGILLRVASYHRRTLRRRLARIVPWSKLDAPQSVAADTDSPAEVVAKRHAARLLDELLGRLDEDKRAVLVLVDVEQLSVPEAAAALDINLNTAYWRLRQARIAFQRALARTRGSARPTGGSPR